MQFKSCTILIYFGALILAALVSLNWVAVHFEVNSARLHPHRFLNPSQQVPIESKVPASFGVSNDASNVTSTSRPSSSEMTNYSYRVSLAESNDEFPTIDANHRVDKQVLPSVQPVILIPGLEGSQMMARLQKNHSDHIYCWRKSGDYYNIWLNMEELVEPMVNCFVDNMRLSYNVTTRSTSNADGVSVHVPGFGLTHTVETLTPSRLQPNFDYFGSLVEHILPIGYSRGLNVKGAPYDFRRAPNEHEAFLIQLQQMIEETATELGKPTVLVCHSMGCLFSLHMLNVRVNSKWKKRNVRALYTISAPWSGAFKALKTLTTGDNMGIFIYRGRAFREMERSFPSIAFLLPSAHSFEPDQVLVNTPQANYTVNDYEALFADIGIPDVYHMQQDTSGLLGNLKHPGVDVYCVYGTGLKTATQLQYKEMKDFPNKAEVIYDTNGDSTVNLASLEACHSWNRSGSRFRHKFHFEALKLDGADHLDILHDSRMLNHLQGVLNAMIG